MISFPNAKELIEFDSRRKTLIAMLAINMSLLHEQVFDSDGNLHPRLTYLRDLKGTYFDPVLGARINEGVLEVQINVVNPEWREILCHEMIEDSFGVVIYMPSMLYDDLARCSVDIETELESLTATIGLMPQLN